MHGGGAPYFTSQSVGHYQNGTFILDKPLITGEGVKIPQVALEMAEGILYTAAGLKPPWVRMNIVTREHPSDVWGYYYGRWSPIATENW